MILHAAVWGRLGRDPMEIDTAAGTRMATASIAVVLDARGPHGETEAIEWCDVIAFTRLADELLRRRQGDTVSVSGRLQVRLWVDRDGRERRTLQIVAERAREGSRVVTPALRPYQHQAVARLREAFRHHRRVLFTLPTGGGKTVVFAHITAPAAARGRRTLVLAQHRELLDQSSAKLGAFGVPHGRIAPGFPETGAPVQVGIVRPWRGGSTASGCSISSWSTRPTTRSPARGATCWTASPRRTFWA